MDDENIVEMYDENGDLCEYKIMHTCEYEGETYHVLWSEDNDDVIAVKETDGEYELVYDDDALAFVQESYSKDMQDLLDAINSLDDEADELIKNIDETLSSINPDHAPFDKEKYILQSQNYYFSEGVKAYGIADYEKAWEMFSQAESDDNSFATTRLGMMLYYGYGCDQDYERAFEYFNRGANGGCPLAGAWLSECFRLGRGVEKDPQKAKDIYAQYDSDLRKMCEVGDTAAEYFLGYNLVMGIGVEEDEAEGFRLLAQAYQGGELRASIALAECYYHGWGVQKDERKTVELLMKHPDPESKKAQYLLGLCNYYGRGTEQNYPRAYFHFKCAAELGHGSAKDYLGDCYQSGYGTKVDINEAVRWYTDAAENHGIGSAAFSLGCLYYNGKLVAEDERKAVKYFLMAAQKGVVPAQRIIASEYVRGKNLEKNYEEARTWIKKAAETGDAEAEYTLGRYYLSGFGFDDEKAAFTWFMKAAEQGYPEAEYAVGECYLSNVYVSVDEKAGVKWVTKAALADFPRAMYRLGVCYLDGIGIGRDSSHGMELLVKAANANESDAIKELASRYFYGINDYLGQSHYINYDEAKKYALLSAQQNDGFSQYLLGVISEKAGASQVAIEWYSKAASNNYNPAKLNLSKLYIAAMVNLETAFAYLQELVGGKKVDPEAYYYLAQCYESGLGCAKDKKKSKQYYQFADNNGYVPKDGGKKKRGWF